MEHSVFPNGILGESFNIESYENGIEPTENLTENKVSSYGQNEIFSELSSL